MLLLKDLKPGQKFKFKPRSDWDGIDIDNETYTATVTGALSKILTFVTAGTRPQADYKSEDGKGWSAPAYLEVELVK